MAAPQLVGAEARAGGGAGRHVLHEDVGAGEQAVEQRAIVGLLDVEHDRLLAAIEPREVGALAAGRAVVVASEVAAVALDLDHARTGVGESAGGERRRHRLLERYHQDAVEGARATRSPATLRRLRQPQSGNAVSLRGRARRVGCARSSAA